MLTHATEDPSSLGSVNGFQVLGLAAEVMAWLGPMIGLPLLVGGIVLRARERDLVTTEVVIVGQPDDPRARWFDAEDIHERPLRPGERSRLDGRDFTLAYVSPTNPAQMRLERRLPITTVSLALGATLVAAGLVGLVVSIADAFVG